MRSTGTVQDLIEPFLRALRGQFLCFAISGVLLEDAAASKMPTTREMDPTKDHALRGGYVRWHVFHFLHEVLTSGVAEPHTCPDLRFTSRFSLRFTAFDIHFSSFFSASRIETGYSSYIKLFSYSNRVYFLRSFRLWHAGLA